MTTPAPSIWASAQNWSHFQRAIGEPLTLTESEFHRLSIPSRLKHLVDRLGDERVIDEINATLRRLGVSHDSVEGGFDCANQGGCRAITIGWEVDPSVDPVFRSISSCRFLAAICRLEERTGRDTRDLDAGDRRRLVRKIVSRFS